MGHVLTLPNAQSIGVSHPEALRQAASLFDKHLDSELDVPLTTSEIVRLIWLIKVISADNRLYTRQLQRILAMRISAKHTPRGMT